VGLFDSFFESGSNGAFSLNDLSLSLRHGPPEDFATLRALGTEAERLEAWFDATAYFHEMRHYHELVGSPSGLGLFLETTRLVDDVLVALRDSETANPVPLLRRAPDSAPARLYRLHQEWLVAILGVPPRPVTPKEASSAGYQLQEFRFPELGLDFAMPLVPVPRYDLLSGKVTERQVPLGLRALMEHSATEIQLFLAAIGAGKDPHDTDDRQGRGRRFIEQFGSLIRGERTEYFVLRLMAQYHLHGRRQRPAGFATTPRLGSLMAPTLAALDIGGYAKMPDGSWAYEHPGLIVAHLLTPWRGGTASFDDDIDAVDQTVRQLIGMGWRDFLADHVRRMKRRPANVIPPHLAPEAAAIPLVGDIRRMVLEDHLAIMLSKAEDLCRWVDPVAYVRSLKQLPLPPLHLAPGNVGFASSRHGAIFLSWSMLLGILEGVMRTGQAECVVATNLAPVMTLFNFPDPTDPTRSTQCHRFVEQRLCGRYDGRFLPGQPPQCPFANLIARLGEGSGIPFRFEETPP
jgi:hypothetical protein